MNRPFFSVVIPTRQRPELIDNCLYSLKMQSFKDFEVIVCDNEFSRTCKDVFDRYADERFRYIQPDTDLEMVDNWRYALDFAKGKYVGYIQDKMFFYYDALEKIHQCILAEEYPDSVSWHQDSYALNDQYHWNQEQSGILYWAAKQSGWIKKSGREALLDKLECRHCTFGYRSTPGPGSLMLGMLKREIIERVKTKYRDFFDCISPDFGGAILPLSECADTIEMNENLAVIVNAYPTTGARATLYPVSSSQSGVDRPIFSYKYWQYAVVPDYPYTCTNAVSGEYNYLVSKIPGFEGLHCNVLNTLIGIAHEKKMAREELSEEQERKFWSKVDGLTDEERKGFDRRINGTSGNGRGLKLQYNRAYNNPKECVDYNVLDNNESTIMDFANSYRYVACYGAGDYGKSIRQYLLAHKVYLDCFIVSMGEKIEPAVDGVPVYEIQEIPYATSEVGIFFGLHQKWHKMILHDLNELGYKHIYSSFDYATLNDREFYHTINHKRVIVFGTGNFASRLQMCLTKFPKDVKLDIVAYSDNNPKLWGTNLYGSPVIIPEDISAVIQKEAIDAVVIAAGRNASNAIVRQLQGMEYMCKTYVFSPNDGFFQGNSSAWNLFRSIDMERPSMPYLEYSLCTHCNLNCNACGVFANIEEKSFREFESFDRDFARLSELYANIDDIRLMGGEPLLHPNLQVFIKQTRKYFPYTNLYIVTNGLLIPKMSSSLIKVIKKCDAVLDITLYLPTFKMWNDILAVLRNNAIHYRISRPVDTFFASVDQKNEIDSAEKFARCLARKCRRVESGFIATCGMPLSGKRRSELVKEKFGVDIPYSENGKFDLHDPSLDGWKLNALMDLQPPQCDFCAVGLCSFEERNDEHWKKWRCGEKPKFDDWC